jgi:light-regulated signal transduction histidine kinase (bacteriophytochrome)
MDLRNPQTPAFGRANLSNCEREQIQYAGSIQPHGALLVLREPDHVVIQASKNASDLLGTERILGRPLGEFNGNLHKCIAPHLGMPLRTIPFSVRCRMGRPAVALDGLLHRPPQGGLIVELEPAPPAVDLSAGIENALQSILSASSLNSLCEEAAAFFKDITGYDRVMVYRFDDSGHGEVFSERRRSDLEPYLGNRYPASDIPQIARRLYERNRVRVLVDVDYAPVPLYPRLSPITGKDLDMSMCWLRSMSPIHIQYLKNMGVSATLVASLVVGGKLWGLIACHHYEPRRVPFEIRTAAELLAESVATRIAALEAFAHAQAELSVRRLEQRVVETIAREGDWRTALFDGSQSVMQPVGASGAALLFEGQVFTTGEVPGTQQLREIGAWLEKKERTPAFSTNSLGLDEPAFASMTPVASGLLATPVSKSGGEYLIWFRPEQVRTVTWGGDPEKSVVIGEDPADLSPRRSFAQWHQLVEGTCEPWSASDLTTARLIGESLADVVAQFRSVQMLIAKDQLEKVGRQLSESDIPIMVTDQHGQILLANEAFDALLPVGHAHLEWAEDLAPFFTGAAEVRRIIQEALSERRSLREELGLKLGAREPTPLMVKVDPVFAAPDRLLGFVFMFMNLTQRRAGEAARRRFQEGISERKDISLIRRDTNVSPLLRSLLSSVVENAQLAAMEITESADTTRIPEMLESVRASVTRATELLDHLIDHAAGTKKGP